MIRCERCSHENSAWATYCGQCDAPLPEPPPVHPDQETLIQRVAEAELESEES